MKENLTAIGLVLLAIGCGSSNSTRTVDYEAGGEGGIESVETGGLSETGGADATGGTESGTGGTDLGTGGTEVGGNDLGTGGTDLGTGGDTSTGGEGSGGTGNTGGNCEPWDCTNIAISLSGWTPESGEPIPEACGLVQDPCTGQYMDCGGCDGWSECGANSIIPDPNWYPGGGAVRDSAEDATPNVCKPVCHQYGEIDLGSFPGCPEGFLNLAVCTSNEILPEGCIDGTGYYLCCASN